MIIKDLETYVANFKTIFVGDYTGAFEKEVTKLIDIHLEDVEQRKAAVAFLCEDYINTVGKVPENEQLDRLASHLLWEHLEGDTRPDKVTLTDYPILTPAQSVRRMKARGEFFTDFVDTASTIGSDGKNHRTPTRRTRRGYENYNVDKQAQERNKKMKAQYKRDTSPSGITSYNMKEEGLRPSFVAAAGIVGQYEEMIGR
jgi:hypothetical protein